MITPQGDSERFGQEIKRKALAAIAQLRAEVENQAEFDVLVGYLEAANDPHWWIEHKWTNPEAFLRIASHKREHTGEM